MKIVERKVIDILHRTPQVISVRVSIAEGDIFQAGQFLGVTLVHGGSELSRYLSFSNSPTEKDYIEFTKRLTDSDFSEALRHLQVGGSVQIKFPLGKFTLDEAGEKHAFLAGGIGITPIRSMWKDVFDQQLGIDMVLLYSNRSAEEILFRADFEAMAAGGKRSKVVFSLDTLHQCPLDWPGRCGYIDAGMIREEIPDYAERIFYVCGPTLMVKKMAEILKTELGVLEDRIRRESISGY